MINRTFATNKYIRNFIGGTKQKELEIFSTVQDTEGNYANCNWLEYRKMVITYFDDQLNVLFSWKNLTHKLSFLFLIISIIFFKIQLIFSILIIISILLQIIHVIFKIKEIRKIKDYDMSLTIISNKINNELNIPN